eukprot:358899-Chlamydomonas_euryale.AAC.3
MQRIYVHQKSHCFLHCYPPSRIPHLHIGGHQASVGRFALRSSLRSVCPDNTKSTRPHPCNPHLHTHRHLLQRGERRAEVKPSQRNQLVKEPRKLLNLLTQRGLVRWLGCAVSARRQRLRPDNPCMFVDDEEGRRSESVLIVRSWGRGDIDLKGKVPAQDLKGRDLEGTGSQGDRISRGQDLEGTGSRGDGISTGRDLEGTGSQGDGILRGRDLKGTGSLEDRISRGQDFEGTGSQGDDRCTDRRCVAGAAVGSWLAAQRVGALRSREAGECEQVLRCWGLTGTGKTQGVAFMAGG